MAAQQSKVVFQAIPAYKSRAETMARAAPPEIDFVVVDANLPEEEQIRQCAGAVALIITPNTFSLNILRGCPSVKLVQTISAGYDRIDVKAAGEMGVLVANNGGANAISVAEHALTLMMSVGRHTMAHWHNTVKEGKWRQSMAGPITELTGKTVGIVGLGHIGKQVAKRLTAFDTDTVYYDIAPIPAETERELNVRPMAFDQLLRESDIVSVHVPLNRQTTGMISTRELGLMKPTAYLINTCRGPVVDEAALYEALTTGVITAAGLDVLEQEPTPVDNPLFGLDNVVVTPHMAGNTQESEVRATAFAMENIQRMLSGQEPESLATPED